MSDEGVAAFRAMRPCTRAELCRALDSMVRTPRVLVHALECNFTVVSTYGHELAMHDALVSMADDPTSCPELLSLTIASLPPSAATIRLAMRIARVNIRAFAAFTPGLRRPGGLMGLRRPGVLNP